MHLKEKKSQDVNSGELSGKKELSFRVLKPGQRLLS